MRKNNNVDLLLNTIKEEDKMITINGIEFDRETLELWMSGLTERELNLLANQDLVVELVPLAEEALAELERIEEEMDDWFTRGDHDEYEDEYEYVDETIYLD